MAGTFLGKYDTTSANNTATGTNAVSVAEGMLPSNINNAFRSIMADIRQHYNDAEWIEYGDGAGAYTPAYVSGTSFTIAGVNVTAPYHVGRRIKAVASTPGTIYGSITAVAFSTNTTVTVAWDSGNLSDEAITSVFVGVLSKTNNVIPTGVIVAANIADDAITTAKINADAITAAEIVDNAINSEHYTDGSIDTAHIASAQVTADKIGTSAVTTAKINADAVTSAKIADDAIDSEHYTDGSIDTAHIAADQITNAKIADDQIDSEHYVNASIDLAHLAASSVNSSKIVDDSIVNADINSSAAIDATKIANGTVTSAEFQYINTLSSNAQTQINAKAATTYVDNAVAGLRTRIIAECASTANINLSNGLEAGDAIDGITLVSGDRVLVKNQSTATENGLYLAVGSGAGASSRDPEHNTIAELSGGMVVVNQGSANDNKIFLCTTDTDATLGSTSITYTTITPQNVGTVTSITGGTGLSGGAITSSGTLAIDSTVTTLVGTQTLTNKTLTSPKINENVAVTSTATELNLLDGKAATNLALIGKQAGTNFTNSLLVGHATTGTLNSAGENTGVGIAALDALTSGDDNTALGSNAGSKINSGSANTTLGRYAGNNITTSSFNAYVGSLSGQLTTGNRNSAVGYLSAKALGSGSDNIAIGEQALTGTGAAADKNIAIGREANKIVTTGASNITIGYQSGDNITSGDGNVIIGGINADSATGDKQLIVADGVDGSVAWIKGDANGQVKLISGYVLEVALTDATTITWNAATQPVAKVTLGASRTMGLPANPVTGQFISLLIIQDGTGSRTITWNAAYEFALDTAPTLTATANLGDLFTFRYNGAKWLEVGRNLALTLS